MFCTAVPLPPGCILLYMLRPTWLHAQACEQACEQAGPGPRAARFRPCHAPALLQVVRDINERQARELGDAADEAKRLKEQVGGSGNRKRQGWSGSTLCGGQQHVRAQFAA